MESKVCLYTPVYLLLPNLHKVVLKAGTVIENINDLS